MTACDVCHDAAARRAVSAACRAYVLALIAERWAA